MRSGRTSRSNSAAVRYPSATAASRSVVPSRAPSWRSRRPGRSRCCGASAVTSMSELLELLARCARGSARCRAAQCSSNDSARVGEQANRLEHVVDDHRLEDVELEVARARRRCRRRRRCRAPGPQTIVSASDCVGFTLPGMIELPGSFSGIVISPSPAARTGREPADVVGDLHERRRPASSARRARRPARRAPRAPANLFGAGDEGHARSAPRSRCAAASPNPRRRVEPGPDGRAAERQLVELRAAPPRWRPSAWSSCAHPAGDLLPERERRRVLQVRAPDLDDVGERLAPSPRASSRSARDAGSSAPRSCSTAAMCIAVGNVSFDDWHMLTSSFGWTGFFEPSVPPASSIARFAITSLTFMFVCVPLPVCQTTSGKWSSSFAVDHLVGGLDDQRRALSAGEQPEARGSPARRAFLRTPKRADDLAAGIARSPIRSSEGSAGSGRPSSGRRGPRSAPWCRSRSGSVRSACDLAQSAPSALLRGGSPGPAALRWPGCRRPRVGRRPDQG